MSALEFHIFLPQMRMSLDVLVERARVAEAAGFVGIWGMDHLEPPAAPTQPMYEAITTTTWLAARTDVLRVGSLVLCDALRHPAVLARQAVTIDHASGGRFELGLGSGSVPDELGRYGFGPDTNAARVRRMGETLEVLRALWSGDAVDFDGEFLHVVAGRQQPTPRTSIPIVIGGTGPNTMRLVERYADWWNVPVHRLDRLEEMRPRAGRARVSTQQMVALVSSQQAREEVTALARRRFRVSGDGLLVGDAAELVDAYGALAERGVERAYVWFADFAPVDTLEAFGAQVISAFARR